MKSALGRLSLCALAGAAWLTVTGCTSGPDNGASGSHAARHHADHHTASGAHAGHAAEHGARHEADPAAEHAVALLERLLRPHGVSGREGPAAAAVAAELRRINPAWQPRTDEAGNLWLQFGAHGAAYSADAPGGATAPPAGATGNASGGASAQALPGASARAPIAFIAHLDEIGVEVTAIRADGLLECKGLGGFHDHLYRGTAIELLTAGGAVLPGIALPGIAPEPFVLDIGARSAAEVAARGVAPGDTATVPKELLRLGAHRVAGRANDDRVGCAALVLALEALERDGSLQRLPQPVSFIWSTREEVGLHGADAAARALRPVPATVYAVDTFVTSDGPRDDPRYAHARLGHGPVLRALDNSSITPPSALAAVRAVAARHDITLQMGTMGGGNDGSRFVPEGAIDCPIAWPQRNSHSRVETLDLRDYQALSQLVAALARDG